MTNEEARSILMGLVTRHNAFSKESAAICKAIDALKQTDVPDTNVGELISRQAVLETLDDMDNALDEDRTVENYKELLTECYEVLPSVTPQPEVIRCKDCKHWTNNIGDSELRDNYCNEEAHGFYYRCSWDDYCSFAERRTDG